MDDFGGTGSFQSLVACAFLGHHLLNAAVIGHGWVHVFLCAVVFGHYHAPVIELPYEINAVLGIRLRVGHRYLNTRREEAILDDGASREGFSAILAPFVCIAQQAEYSGIIDSPLNAVGGYLFLGYSLGKGRVKDRQRKPKIKVYGGLDQGSSR